MAEKTTTSQAQHGKAGMAVGFDGGFGADAWKKMADESLVRVGQWLDEMGKLERAGVEQATKAIEESTKLMHEGVQYAAQLSAEWRKTSMEMARRALELTHPQG